MTIIRGLDNHGNEVFYTGKAGPAFVSPDESEAFDAFNLEGARRKATILNRMTKIHGYRFTALHPEYNGGDIPPI